MHLFKQSADRSQWSTRKFKFNWHIER